MNTAWFTLWTYDLVRAGPPVILFAAGTRVPFIPKIFEGYDTVMVSSWSHESQEVALHGLLVLLNDALTYAPVMVAGHCFRGVPVEVEHVPFPIPEYKSVRASAQGHTAQDDLLDLLGSSSTDMDPVAINSKE